MAQKAIIVGAATGIGAVLAKIMSEHGYELGLADINIEDLKLVSSELPNKNYSQYMDLVDHQDAVEALHELIEKMGNVDVIILNAGVRLEDPDLDWEKEQQMIAVNVTGFTALATAAMHYFLSRGSGQLVGTSSIAGLKGHRFSPVYDGTKAYIEVLLEGLRDKVNHLGLPITITTIQPGLVDTKLTTPMKKTFWVSPVNIAAQQIYQAIVAKKKHAYITKRWRLVAWALKFLPDWLLQLY